MRNKITFFFILAIGVLSGQSVIDPDNIVIGADQLPTETSTDSVFYFHKATMSWRSGLFEDGIALPSQSRKWSAAWGRNNNVGGDFSTGWGNANLVTSLHGTTWGETNTITGNFGTAWGKNNQVTEIHSTAWGTENEASGGGSTVWGAENKSTGNLSTAWGGESQANGDLTTVWGIGNRADSIGATTWGVVNRSLNYHATSWGRDNHALGIQSTAIGQGNGTRSTNSFVAGQFNEFSQGGLIIDIDVPPVDIIIHDDFGNQFTGEDTHQLFVIGNGNSTNDRSNAVTVTKSGRLGIGVSLPASALNLKSNEELRFGPTASITGEDHSIITNSSIIPTSISRNLGTSDKRWGRVYTVAGVLTTSDIRLKENIQPIGKALDKIEKLNPISYNLISNPKEREIGFSAQALESVVPEAVHKDKFINDQGDTDFHYGVNYSELIPILTKAIQEQQMMITELQKEVAVLKQK